MDRRRPAFTVRSAAAPRLELALLGAVAQLGDVYRQHLAAGIAAAEALGRHAPATR